MQLYIVVWKEWQGKRLVVRSFVSNDARVVNDRASAAEANLEHQETVFSGPVDGWDIKLHEPI